MVSWLQCDRFDDFCARLSPAGGKFGIGSANASRSDSGLGWTTFAELSCFRPIKSGVR